MEWLTSDTNHNNRSLASFVIELSQPSGLKQINTCKWEGGASNQSATAAFI